MTDSCPELRFIERLVDRTLEEIRIRKYGVSSDGDTMIETSVLYGRLHAYTELLDGMNSEVNEMRIQR
jgi:hypothetical protein